MNSNLIGGRTFALVGAAGYIAPRHLDAMSVNGGNLIAAMDPSDSVGILDRYYPEAKFFTSYERFERFLSKKKTDNNPVDFVSICSPNYLHDTHCRLALNNAANAICEKPLVLFPKNLKRLAQIELDTGQKIFCILQLRLHSKIKALRDEVCKDKSAVYEVNLEYITSRGPWYNVSWKGDGTKSGGLLFNIGIHFFDMLLYVFGEAKSNELLFLSPESAAGRLCCKQANINWKLSTDRSKLPKNIGKSTFREITINDKSLEFSEGFTDLHQESYAAILNGNGFGLDDVMPSIQLVSALRSLGGGGRELI